MVASFNNGLLVYNVEVQTLATFSLVLGRIIVLFLVYSAIWLNVVWYSKSDHSLSGWKLRTRRVVANAIIIDTMVIYERWNWYLFLHMCILNNMMKCYLEKWLDVDAGWRHNIIVYGQRKHCQLFITGFVKIFLWLQTSTIFINKRMLFVLYNTCGLKFRTLPRVSFHFENNPKITFENVDDIGW